MAVSFVFGSRIPLSFCAMHAEAKAGEPDVEVTWLSTFYRICPECWRVLPALLEAAEHYDLLGYPCPPEDRIPQPAH